MERYLVLVEWKNIAKTSILLKAMYTVNAIPTKIPMVSFTEIEQIILIFVWNHKGSQIAKAILRKENRLAASSSRLYTTLWSYSHQKSVELAQKQAHGSEEQNRGLSIQPTCLGSVNLWQRGQEHTKGKDSAHNKQRWENWMPHAT